ncbi:SusD-like starch-binding protein associating with outer membrane [Chitinophaga niastensis]|uniref:SusD-like starch-binding protein associating with outer membrane n=1 Tax=Chitinophaga niastensis TaxID=536980 RepID=A0A2P8HLW2_CHINA|nr:RagB/SusD family nutrient uptake outer membrane protein [Chitinophaga niastensis]PSL47205.1 SusD-like starch-binding protein associating with outer membrane [Chitinophaga niastensis]
MINKRLIYIAITAGCMMAGACTKFLDIVPKGKDTPHTLDQYNGLLNSVTLINYSDVTQYADGSSSIKGGTDMNVMMGDDMISDSLYLSQLGPSYINSYTWKDNIYQPDEDAIVWGAFYGQNYTYNLVANNVMQVTDGNIQKKKQLQAEARVGRALMHFMLLNYFAKPYDPATAATDPGVPLVTEANALASGFKRASVQEVYSYIVNELTAAIPDLPEVTPMRLRMGKSAGYYILGQVYLTMGKYDLALPVLQQSKAALANSAVPVHLYDYNQLMPTWTSPFMPSFGAFNMPLQFDNEENIYLKQVSLLNFIFSNAGMVSPATLAKFDPADLRLNFFYGADYFTGATKLPYQLHNSPFGVNYGPNLPGLYLMLAECKARTGDLAGATADLITLRSARMPVAKAGVSATTQDDLIRFVIDERLREFACTGQRWFDMRRLSTDPLFKNITYTHTLGSATFTMPKARLTMKIPPKILLLNPGMVDNP